MKTVEEKKAYFLGQGLDEPAADKLAKDEKISFPDAESGELIVKLAAQIETINKSFTDNLGEMKTKIKKMEDSQLEALKSLQKKQTEVGIQSMIDTSIVRAEHRAFADDLKTNALKLQLYSVIRGYQRAEQAKSSQAYPIPIGELPETKRILGISNSEELDKACSKVSGLAGDVLRTMDPASTGYGQELVANVASNVLIDKIRIASPLIASIYQLPFSSATLTIPTGLTDITWRYGGRGTGTGGDRGAGETALAIRASDRGTGLITMTPGDFEALVWIKDSMVEDSIVPLASFLERSLIDSGAEQLERSILMGDKITAATGNINSDDAAPASDDYWLIFDGMARKCLTGGASWVESTSAALALTHLDSVAAKLGKFLIAAGGANLAVSPSMAIRIVNLFGTQAATNLMNGTVVNGIPSFVAGMRCVLTNGLEMTEADGKMSVTAASNTKYNLQAYNKNSPILGIRRDFIFEAFRVPQTRNGGIVASARFDLQFAHLTDTAKGVPLVYVYNKT